jgi:hypothetical protein
MNRPENMPPLEQVQHELNALRFEKYQAERREREDAYRELRAALRHDYPLGRGALQEKRDRMNEWTRKQRGIKLVESRKPDPFTAHMMSKGMAILAAMENVND